jgi:hypothetical protein
MNKVWLFLVATWRIIVWWAKRDAATQLKRKELQDELDKAIKSGDTRALHRLMSKL